MNDRNNGTPQCLTFACMETTDPGGRFQNTANCEKKIKKSMGLLFLPAQFMASSRHNVLAGSFMGVSKNLGPIAGLSVFNGHQSPVSAGTYILGTLKSVYDAIQSKTSDFEFPEMKAEVQSGASHLSTIFS